MPLKIISYKFIVLAVAFIFASGNATSQKGTEPSRFKQFNITVNAEGHTIKTQMLSCNKDIKLNNERVYLWYGSQKIMETKGGYAGKLIHGYYRDFYLNSQLKEQGEIRYGLKNKEWKYWYPDGNLREVICWKNGVKNGTYILYNDYGQIMAKGKFRKDKLHGKFYTYGPTGKIIDTKKYNKGDEMPAKLKPVKSKKTASVSPDTKPVKEKTIKEKKAKPVTKKTKARQDSTAKKPSFFDRVFKKKAPGAKPIKPVVEKRKVINS